MIAGLLSYTAMAAVGGIYSAWLCRNRLRKLRNRVRQLEKKVEDQ